MIRRLLPLLSRQVWNPGRLPGTPREWLAGPTWCFTDGSASLTAASSQFLSVASNATLQTGDVDFWVAGWVNRTSVVGFDGVVSKGLALSSGGEFDLFFNNTSNQMTWRVRRADDASGPTVVQPSAFSNGEWAFVLAWHDSTNDVIRIRLNDGTVYTTAMSGGGFVSTNTFRLGALSTVNPLNGRLASWAWGKSPPGGIASVISTISSRLYAGGNGIVYADTTPAEQTAWGLVSWWDLVRSGNFTDSHGSNNLTNNNGVSYGGGLPRARAGDTDPVSAWVDRWQGTLWSEADPLKRLVLRDLGGGRWVLRSDGVNDGIGHGPATTGARTIAMSYTQTAVSARVLQAAGASNSVVSPRRGGNNLVVGGTLARGTVWADDTAAHVFSMQRSGAGPWRAWSDGVSLAVTDQTANFGSLGVGAFTGAFNASETFTGDLYSVVDTNADISDADRAALTTYLARLYGGSL